jgi:hypothetical protein
MLGALQYLKQGKPEAYEEPKLCTTKEARREWYWNKFSKDKKSSWLNANQSQRKVVAIKTTRVDGWFTVFEIASMNKIAGTIPNYKQLCACLVEDLPEKPYPNSAC